MCPEIYQTFAKLLASTGVAWGEEHSVLEIGATLEDDTLLTLPCLAKARRTGVNMDPEIWRKQSAPPLREFTIFGIDAHRLLMETHRYSLVLCNSVLEHDSHFWQTLSEMRRVLKPDGWLAVGAPSFSSRLDLGKERTITMERHDFPADYYRFSPAMFREVVFGGFNEVTLLDIMDPPRCVGIGRKP